MQLLTVKMKIPVTKINNCLPFPRHSSVKPRNITILLKKKGTTFREIKIALVLLRLLTLTDEF